VGLSYLLKVISAEHETYHGLYLIVWTQIRTVRDVQGQSLADDVPICVTRRIVRNVRTTHDNLYGARHRRRWTFEILEWLQSLKGSVIQHRTHALQRACATYSVQLFSVAQCGL